MATVNFTYDYPYTYHNKEKGRFTWAFSESRVTLNGCYTYPIQFHSSIPCCSHITCHIEIENTGSGTVLGRSWDFYIYRDSGPAGFWGKAAAGSSCRFLSQSVYERSFTLVSSTAIVDTDHIV